MAFWNPDGRNIDRNHTSLAEGLRAVAEGCLARKAGHSLSVASGSDTAFEGHLTHSHPGVMVASGNSGDPDILHMKTVTSHWAPKLQGQTRVNASTKHAF